jgi:transporter family-2 protein
MAVWGLILVAIAGGLATTIQGQLVGLMDQAIGTRGSLLVTYLTGIGVAAGLAATGEGIPWRQWSTLPWYTFTSGFLGIIIVGSISFAVPRLGLATTFTVMVATQFALSALIDHWGWLGATVRPIDVQKIAGLAAVLVGVRLLLK